MRTTTMAHLVDRHFVERANTVLLLSVLWGAFAACVVGALVYDLAYWFGVGLAVMFGCGRGARRRGQVKCRYVLGLAHS